MGYEQEPLGFAVRLQSGAQLRYPHAYGLASAGANGPLSVRLRLRGGSGGGTITIRGQDDAGHNVLHSECFVDTVVDEFVSCPVVAQPHEQYAHLLITFSSESHPEAAFVYLDSFQVVASAFERWVTV